MAYIIKDCIALMYMPLSAENLSSHDFVKFKTCQNEWRKGHTFKI